MLAGALLVIGTGWSEAKAADAAGRFAVRGVGSRSCGDYRAALGDAASTAPYASWLMGYVSARNRNSAELFDVLPTQPGIDLLNVVAVICGTRETMVLETAASEAVRVLRPLSQASETPLVQFRTGKGSVTIRQGALVRLQTALIDRKLFKGPANGIPSAEFAAALRAFQKKEAIPVTGLPDMDSFIRAILKG
jgi:hypothetical protein